MSEVAVSGAQSVACNAPSVRASSGWTRLLSAAPPEHQTHSGSQHAGHLGLQFGA